ncbi:MAG: HRDC domain-containing protein, partial [Anaerolineae bacterium]|nr:HRDC domain-containing protein [Anaerolineae bacterium]
RYGERFLDALSRGRTAPLPKRPQNDLPDPVVAERYTILHSWRKERAAQRNLDSSLILPKQTLWELARELPKNRDELSKIQGMGAWRMRTYGDDLLQVLRKLR